jgi:hypothetical protein
LHLKQLFHIHLLLPTKGYQDYWHCSDLKGCPNNRKMPTPGQRQQTQQLCPKVGYAVVIGTWFFIDGSYVCWIKLIYLIYWLHQHSPGPIIPLLPTGQQINLTAKGPSFVSTADVSFHLPLATLPESGSRSPQHIPAGESGKQY